MTLEAETLEFGQNPLNPEPLITDIGQDVIGLEKKVGVTGGGTAEYI